MTDINPDSLKVVELRDALSERGLDTKGNKPALVSRLKEYLSTVSRDNPGAPEPSEYDPTNPTEDTEPATEFGDKNFVNVTPRGIKFSLSAPKPAKPVPASPRPPSPGPQLDSVGEGAAGGGIRRSGAAAFFLTEVERIKNKEAKVPLPPSFGYQIEDDDEDEEEGPPGMVPLKLPALKFDKPFTKDLGPKDVEYWKKIEMPDLYTQRRDGNYV